MKLLYLITEDWYFYSHRLPMARGAFEAGFDDVVVVANVSQHKEKIESLGIRVIPWSLNRRSLNPFAALRQISDLIEIYRSEKPDIVHHVAMKPILFGSIAAIFAKTPHVLNAFAGLGIIFHSDIFLARIIRPVLNVILWFLLKRPESWILFQNADDLARLDKLKLIKSSRAIIIRGSGVDIDRYAAKTLPLSPPFICAFAGRMIDSKGLPTLRDAFDILKVRAPHIHLWLCGKPDAGNPGSWSEDRLNEWTSSNPNVYWKGHQVDMGLLWPQVHLALQPSWGGEGLPKALLEAGACGRAMVASDVSGCREVVIQEQNGLLVPPENAEALADAIMRLDEDRELCAAMGQASRDIVTRYFSAEFVSCEIKKLYLSIMAS